MRATSFRPTTWLSPFHRIPPYVAWPHRRRTEAWLPRRLLLIRHGESEANADRSVYSRTPDWCIPLTARGHEQAMDCGRRVRQIVQDETLYIYYSPYQRARQTLEDIRVSLDPRHIWGEREDERLREQEMGNFQPMQDMDKTWSARNRYGRLFYRFPMGESGADVGDRVSCFFDSLLRERACSVMPSMNDMMPAKADSGIGVDCSEDRRTSMPGSDHTQETSAATSTSPSHRVRSTDSRVCTADGTDGARSSFCQTDRVEAAVDTYSHALPSESGADTGGCGMNFCERGWMPMRQEDSTLSNHNVIIVSHGLLIRLFLGSWFRLPLEVTQTMQNPCNCAIVVLERDDSTGKMTITPQSMQLFQSDVLIQYMKSHSNQGR